MSGLHFYILIFSSRATMIKRFQNNSMYNIQRKLRGSDAISAHGGDHSNRSTSKHQQNSSQSSPNIQSISSFPYSQ